MTPPPLLQVHFLAAPNCTDINQKGCSLKSVNHVRINKYYYKSRVSLIISKPQEVIPMLISEGQYSTHTHPPRHNEFYMQMTYQSIFVPTAVKLSSDATTMISNYTQMCSLLSCCTFQHHRKSVIKFHKYYQINAMRYCEHSIFHSAAMMQHCLFSDQDIQCSAICMVQNYNFQFLNL